MVLAASPELAHAAPGDTDSGDLRANLTAVGFYTDNFFYQPIDQQAASGTLIRPELAYLTETGKTSLSLTGRGEYGTFDTPGSNDDYFDALGTIRMALLPTYRNRLDIDAGVNHSHDPYGLVRTEGAASSDVVLDRWNETHVGGRYRYGAPTATLNTEIGVSALDRTYTTNRDSTQYLDYGTRAADLTLYYNYGPKTSVLVSAGRTNVSFDHPFDNNMGPGGTDLDDRSGNMDHALAGVRWVATAKTSGEVRVGYRRRTFDNVAGELHGLDWQAGVEWTPVIPFAIEFKSGRSEDQSYRIDARVIDDRWASLNLKTTLTARAKTGIGVDYQDLAFFGSSREDRGWNYHADVEYVALSYLYVVANAGYQSRDSDLVSRDYHRFSGFVGLRLGRGG